MGIGTAHFGAGFGGCEHPFDAGGSGVSLSFPRGDFADEALDPGWYSQRPGSLFREGAGSWGLLGGQLGRLRLSRGGRME